MNHSDRAAASTGLHRPRSAEPDRTLPGDPTSHIDPAARVAPVRPANRTLENQANAGFSMAPEAEPLAGVPLELKKGR